MKLISVTGESVAPGKGGSPSDTFDRSIATWEANNEQKTVTVTYCRYFGKVLAERGIYDEETEGVPVMHLVARFLWKRTLSKERPVTTSTIPRALFPCLQAFPWRLGKIATPVL